MVIKTLRFATIVRAIMQPGAKPEEAKDPHGDTAGRRLAIARRVLEIEAGAVARLAERLDANFSRAVSLLLDCSGRVVVTGLGKSGLVARKIAATLNSTGTPSLYLHPAEALHGDLGMLVRGDVVVALSQGGETDEILRLLEWIKRLDLKLIALTGAVNSTLSRNADVVLDVGVEQEACSLGLAPTASTTAALAMGDALAVAVAESKGFAEQDFARLHPGGWLGKRLATVSRLMHTGEELPRVREETPFSELIYEMSRKGFGITSVVDDGGRLRGIISDGDLRRLFARHGPEAARLKAGDCMTSTPVTIAPESLASAALNLMEAHRITCLLVTEKDGRLLGLIHLHDLWTTGMM